MIIGLCGRQRSGKREISMICENHGYSRLYFALPLKKLCMTLLGKTMYELDMMKNEHTPIEFVFDDASIDILSNDTGIPKENLSRLTEGKLIKDVRELLQFVGTDIIREFDPNWHVNKIREMIDTSKDYVIDDVRFPNEKSMIEELGGECWFIVRPTIADVSNHECERSIKWQDCGDRIIVNDSTLLSMTFKWNIFMNNYDVSTNLRKKEIERIIKDKDYNSITSMSISDVMMLSRHYFTYEQRDIDIENVESFTQESNNTLTVKYKDGTSETIDNPLNIEDLKIYL